MSFKDGFNGPVIEAFSARLARAGDAFGVRCVSTGARVKINVDGSYCAACEGGEGFI